MPETANKEVYQPMTFDAIKIGLASPDKIRAIFLSKHSRHEDTPVP